MNTNWQNMCTEILRIIFQFLPIYNNNIGVICKEWTNIRILLTEIIINNDIFKILHKKHDNRFTLNQYNDIILKKMLNKIYISHLSRINLLCNIYVTNSSMSILNEFDPINLIRLDLEYTNIKNEGIRIINQFKKLKYLNISRTRIMDDDLIILSDLIDLEFLNISYTKIVGEGFKYLPPNSKLQHIDLAFTSIENINIHYINEKTSQLAYLDLQGTHINDQAIEYLSNFANLKHLDLKYIDIKYMKCISFLKMLKKLEHLELNILNSKYFDCLNLMEFKQLKYLNMRLFEPVDKKDIDHLKKCIPHCIIEVKHAYTYYSL